MALFQDGELKLAANEERFTRIKFDGSYPVKLIEWCLQEAKLFPPYLCKYRQPISKNYLKKKENTEKQKEINLS